MSSNEPPQIPEESLPEMPLSKEQGYLLTASALLVATVAGGAALAYTKPVAVPFVLSLLISYLVGPMVDWMQRRFRFPKALALLVAFLVAALFITLIVMLITSSARGLSTRADFYSMRIEAMIAGLTDFLASMPSGMVPDSWLQGEFSVQEIVELWDVGSVVGALQTAAGSVLQAASKLVANALLVLLFSAFLLARRRPDEKRSEFFADINRRIGAYLSTKFLTSASTGLLTGVLLAIIGVDLAFVFGLLAFLLNFIPSIGSIIAVFLPLPIVLLQFDNLGMVLLALLLPGSIQFLIGNVLEPKIMGDNLDLHPVTVLMGLLFWGMIWGPVGALLSTPLIAVIKIVLVHIEFTRPIGELLAGRLPQAEDDSAPLSPS